MFKKKSIPNLKKSLPQPAGEKSTGSYNLFRFVVKSELGLDLQPEFYFHPSRKWRFDFALPDLMIAIEVEGGVFSNGRHTRGKGFIKDMEKYNSATVLGWSVLRFTPEQLLKGETLQIINNLKKFRLNCVK